MNLAITTTSARTWKTVKAHYILAIAGATLAISSIVGAASIGSVDFGGGNTVVGRPVSLAAASADQQYVTYYLVDSEAQRELVFAGEAEAARERYSSGIPDPNASIAVFIAHTPEEVVAARMAIYEGMTSFSDTTTVVRLVDFLR
jgi:hypothetical protein